MELALKIVSKIKAKERFAVYIVVPLWPEGIPTSAAVQEILFWQGQTMDMMYKVIADALKEAGLSDTYHPQDYLNFYCLGKREPVTKSTPPTTTTANNNNNISPDNGEVYGYRMSLWAEHMGGRLSDLFHEPESVECVRYVNKLAEENWLSYESPDIKEMNGHLMWYPLKVDKDGGVSPLPALDCFPDVGGKILGAHSTLPDVLTT